MARSPLFDIYDPLGTINNRALLGLLPQEDDEDTEIIGAFERPRSATISDLMPQEEKQGWLRKLANAGTSGLAGLGWILDTPGAVVRGTLAEGPVKGLSALWETSDDRVTGRELLRKYKMIGEEDTWGNFAGSLAAEALLDPTTYMSFGLNQFLGKGAKTISGKAAQKAGLLEDFGLYARNVKEMGEREALRKSTARELIERLPESDRSLAQTRFESFGGKLDDPLARMNRIGVPFLEQGATDLYGEAFGDWAAKAADTLGESAATNRFTGPVVNRMTAAFDKDVLGVTDYDQQWEARAISSARAKRAAKDRARLAELQFDAETALNKSGRSLNDADISRELRKYWELGNEAVDPSLSDVMNIPEVGKLRAFWEGYRDEALAEAQKLGMPIEEFRSRAGTQFVSRQQLGFDLPQLPEYPEGVVPAERLKRVRRRGASIVDVSDAMGKRRDYTDVYGGTDTLNRMSLDADLQDRLRKATPQEARGILGDWAAKNNEGRGLYDWIDDQDPDTGEFIFSAPSLGKDHPLVKQREALKADISRAAAAGDDETAARLSDELGAVEKQIPGATREAYKDSLNADLGDLMRSLDPQHAAKGKPIFGQNVFNEISGYTLKRGEAETDADMLLSFLKDRVESQAAKDTVGGVNYTAQDTLKKLGLTGDNAESVLAERLGVDSLDNISFNKKYIDDWAKVVDRGRLPQELSAPMEAYDNFTKSFKTLALLWPARYVRDLYSGAFASASKKAFSPKDWFVGGRIRKGNYKNLPDMLRDLPDYRGLSDEQIVRKFLVDGAEQGLGTSTFADETLSGASGSQLREMYPGAAKPTWSDIGRRAYNPDRTWSEAIRDFNPFAVRTSGGNRNPVLELGDRAAETTDAMNRYGTYLNQVRKGVAPSEARRIADLTQVNYRNNTNFENDVLKRIAPFYSYTRGIMPFIADQVIDNPQGLTGQSIRAVTRASQPSEDTFIPEYLRQSAAIPIPAELGGNPGGNLQRFLTQVDLPYESTVNLFSPGVGNDLFSTVSDTARKTALNLLGQTNPLIKGPLELATNRQFFSGRQLSDLYSMLEQPLGAPGRVLEQVISNAPGGSRLLGTTRQIMDDRISAEDKATKLLVNTLLGVKLQDVDQERTKRLAARNMLNELLETTPGVRTYENITVPDEVLQRMPENQRKQYLLYRILQAEAAKRAREKKKQEAALDPLQVLGVTNRL